MRFQLADELRQVLQASTQPIKFIDCQNVNSTFPDFGHHSVQSFTCESRPTCFVQILDDLSFRPSATDVSANFAQLACVALRVSRDAPINCNAFCFHAACFSACDQIGVCKPESFGQQT